MKTCPQCRIEPRQHFARNQTWKINDKRNWFLVGGCKHFEQRFGKNVPAMPESDLPALAAQWDEEAEKVFAAYTATWTDAQRDAFRLKIWPPPPPVIPSELLLT